jgi:hypothetical protein
LEKGQKLACRTLLSAAVINRQWQMQFIHLSIEISLNKFAAMSSATINDLHFIAWCQLLIGITCGKA